MIWGFFLLIAATAGCAALTAGVGIVICWFMDSMVDVPREQDEEGY